MKLQAVILDWAGTVVDHGSRAPMGAFVRAFAEFGVAISIADARGPMGMAKWDHIRSVGQAPAVAAAWRAKHGREFNEADVDAIFRVFEPMNVAAVRDHADVIPGAIEAVAALRERGLLVGATTGYTRAIMAELEPLAAANVAARHHIVHANHVSARLCKLRAIVGVAARRHGSFFGADDPAHRKFAFLAAVRAHQVHVLVFGLLVVKTLFVHHAGCAAPDFAAISSMLKNSRP